MSRETSLYLAKKDWGLQQMALHFGLSMATIKRRLRKYVKTFRNSWDLHKYRSLKHKCPKWVWEQGLMQLALYAERNQLNFTELRQKMDLEKIQVDDDAGIVIPRIICPLERKRALALERLVRQMDISWKNSIKYYLKIRDYVLSYQ
ncbi:hypothetical protein DAPPUDRAFT_317761 [Daphnia pulex]|uniref:Uncharacterized protein n=1 Tax=Daphnia pulex TaxID=6669 RepID=E9GGW6_DAPPU|nr:hypothetical protein DAPPUDRAFT_317761 [Daphnia pulex]|eukprot:EFX81289.1 hypothetical protein DAPPUDRAFT_317761 [Daphnia pulex]